MIIINYRVKIAEVLVCSVFTYWFSANFSNKKMLIRIVLNISRQSYMIFPWAPACEFFSPPVQSRLFVCNKVVCYFKKDKIQGFFSFSKNCKLSTYLCWIRLDGPAFCIWFLICFWQIQQRSRSIQCTLIEKNYLRDIKCFLWLVECWGHKCNKLFT